jgi:hypothetical protein
MPIAFGSDGLTMMSPAEFVAPEIEVARRMGALLRDQFSKTTQSTYLANTCQSCGAFCGEHYLHDFWENEPCAPPSEVALGCVDCFTALALVPDSDGKIWTGSIPLEEDEDDSVSPAPVPFARTPSSKPTTRQASPPPPTITRVAPSWGRCAECSASACPMILNDGKFFCSQCRGIRKFVPDL